MKPSEALAALSILSSMVTEMEVRWRSVRVVDDSIRAAMDAGKIDLIEAGQRAADIIAEERGEPKEFAPPGAEAVAKPEGASVQWVTGDRVRDKDDATEYLISDVSPSTGYDFRLTRVDGHGYTDLNKRGLDQHFALVDRAPYGRRADGTPKARPGRKAKPLTAEERMRAGELPEEAVRRSPALNLSPGETNQAKAPVDEAKNAAELRAIRSALEGGPLTVGELVMNSGVSRPDVMRHLAAGALIEEYTGVRDEKLDPLPLVRLISQRPS